MNNNHYVSEPFPHRWSPKTRIPDLSSVDRPREKLIAKGGAALCDAELLSILLGSGTKKLSVLDLSSTILSAVQGNLASVDVQTLLKIHGVGRAKACQLVAAMELGRRHLSRKRGVIRDAEDAIPYLSAIRAEKQEHFVCLSLNGANEVLATRVVTVGLLDSNQVHPREVYADPITDRAASILCAHNHPSGTLEASPEDLAMTRRLVKAGEVLGIRVLDHLIVTKDGFLSLKQTGQL
ncbi:DNA repair protein RadC [Candidatus Bipolaricaulota bacterium]|nr:DNA repair protein RadC [Candidatus Bipolaricaulota bacterium]